MNSLTHSLTHSDLPELPTGGLGYPDPTDVPSWLDFCVLEAQQIRNFNKSREFAIHSTALKFVEVQEEILQIQYSKKRTKYWFVTINPKASIEIKDLHNKIVTMLDRPEVVDCLWTYEIREAPDKGLHAHICFQTSKIMDANFVNRKIKQQFVPSMCGNTKHVDVRWPDSLAEYDKCKEYATKKTSSKKKKPGVLATLKWRKDNRIHDKFTEDHLLVWSSLSPRQLETDLSLCSTLVRSSDRARSQPEGESEDSEARSAELSEDIYYLN